MSVSSKAKTRKSVQKMGWMGTALNMTRGGMLALAVVLLFIAVVSFMTYKGLVNETVGKSASLAACLLGAFIGSTLCGRKGEGQRFLRSLGIGVILSMMILALSVLMYDGEVSMGRCGICVGMCLCGGGLGGMVGGNKGKKRK